MPETTFACKSIHPDDSSIVCMLSGDDHLDHESRSGEDWPNAEYTDTRGVVKKKSIEITQGAKPVEHAPPAVAEPVTAQDLGLHTVKSETQKAQAAGMKASLDAAGDVFKEAAMLSIEFLALNQESLTTDDVWKDLRDHGIDTEHRTSMGSLIRKAASNGWIEKTDRMVSTSRDDQRAHGLIVWRSLVYTSKTA